MNNPLSNSDKSYSDKVAVGAAFMVATRFSVRLLGLVSVTILARLLTPEDFGVFGTAALVLTFFLMIKDIGFGAAIIKTENITKDDIDTLWTIQLILGCVTAATLYFLIEPIATFLKEPRVVDVLQLMAIIPVIDSFYSPATSLLMKDFKYAHTFVLKSVDKLVRVIAVIILALTLKSYWALVFGSLLASVFGVIVSHIARPYLPRLTFVKLKNFFGFTIWTYFRSIARYIATSADEVVVRASENSALFGIYHVARDLSRVLITEIISPIGEALLPALVKFSDETERFSNAVRDIVGIYVIASFAVTFGIIATSTEIVLLLLGPQWPLAGEFLAIIAIGCACNSMGDINYNIFIAKNIPRHAAMFWSIRAASYASFCLVAGIVWGAKGVAYAFSIASMFVFALELMSIFRLTPTQTPWILLFIRPSLAAMVMLLGVWSVSDIEAPLFATTVIKVGVGVFLYGVTLYGLWVLVGKPAGPERSLILRLPQKLQSLLL